MYHEVQLIGNLVKDPELEKTPSGQEVCNFIVASNHSYMKNGENETEAVFFRISTWGRLSATCYKYLSQSDLVFVRGRLKSNNLEGDNVFSPGIAYNLTGLEVKFLKTKSREDNKGKGIKNVRNV